ATSSFVTSTASLPASRSPSRPLSSRQTPPLGQSSSPHLTPSTPYDSTYTTYLTQLSSDNFDYSLLDTSPEASSTNHPQGTVIFETQQIAPAPGQTWFQLAVLEGRGASGGGSGGEEGNGEEGEGGKEGGEERERPKSSKPDPRNGVVVLRDWPKKRFSQKWTRNGPNPGERRMTYEEFLQGELEERLVYIFGRDTYDAAVRAVQQVIADRRESFAGSQSGEE
ncbi:hypothetical protein HDV00_005237, partial [Rhizophlyctis rosea]